jgi:hypothetical protein
MADMHTRMVSVLMPLLVKHGMPAPLGVWEAVSGHDLRKFVWMLPWPDYQTRANAFRNFYTDWRAWQAEHPEPEFVERTDVTILEPWPDSAMAFSQESSALEELWTLRLRLGLDPAAKADMIQAIGAALIGAGALVCGVFDLVFGDLPQSMLLLSWPDETTRRKSRGILESDSRIARLRDAQSDRFSRDLVERSERILLERASYWDQFTLVQVPDHE